MTDRPQTRRVQPAPTMGAQANLICRPMSALSNVTYDGDQRFVGCNRDPDNTLTLRGTDSSRRAAEEAAHGEEADCSKGPANVRRRSTGAVKPQPPRRNLDSTPQTH